MPSNYSKKTPKGSQRRKKLSFYDEIARPYDEKARTPIEQSRSRSIKSNSKNKNRFSRPQREKKEPINDSKFSNWQIFGTVKTYNPQNAHNTSTPSSGLVKFYLIAGGFIIFCILFTIVFTNCSASISRQDKEITDNMLQIESEYNENIVSYNKTFSQYVTKEAETQSYPKVLSTITDLPSSENSVSYSGNKEPSQQNKTNLENEVNNIVINNNTDLSFCMIDIFTQNCVYYNIDKKGKTFSCIKGPFLSADACQIDGFVDKHEEELYQAIKYSENAPYDSLWYQYGTSYMQNWLDELNITDSLEGLGYPEHFRVRSMAKLWTKIFQEFNHNDSIASFVADFVHTKDSAIDKELGGKYLVQSKAGWGDDTEDYTGINDCGIVNSGQSPYILCIFSGFNYNPEHLQQLVKCIDNCHNDMV